MTTRIRILFTILFYFFAHSAWAQSEYPSLLWEIKGNDLAKPSYLYGTMHSFDSRAFRFTKQAERYIQKSDIFAMEMIMDIPADDPMWMLPKLLMPGDTTLNMLMDSLSFLKLNQYMTDTLQMPLIFFARVKPFFLMAFFMQDDHPLSIDRSTFLDYDLSKRAKKFKKPVIGLETMEEQLRAVDAIPLREQAKMLLDAIDSESDGNSQDDELLLSYEKADLSGIYSLYKKEDLSNTFNASLITTRNTRMVDRMEVYIKQGKSLFTAVGALHLPGEEGIINLLRKKGYIVTPITLKH